MDIGRRGLVRGQYAAGHRPLGQSAHLVGLERSQREADLFENGRNHLTQYIGPFAEAGAAPRDPAAPLTPLLPRTARLSRRVDLKARNANAAAGNRRAGEAAPRGAPEKCILVGLRLGKNSSMGGGLHAYTAEESLDELEELARGAGAEVLGRTLQSRDAPDPLTAVGAGKVREIKDWAAECEPDFVLFDCNLTPSQQRNLARGVDCRVLDRTQLILDIFARHAHTREGRLQVESAQLHYMLPRLAGRGAAMSRLGAGIGTRGPGETQLETDRRRIRRRIDKLEASLEKVRSTRKLQRDRRTAGPARAVALAGYANAGKSTLFNALAAANVLTDRKMFATLDPTIRRLTLPSNRQALLADTVGFIRNLPTTLVKAFRATLEEVTEAAMILHVVDAAAPQRRARMEEVERLLAELGASGKPQLLVLNKCDLLTPAERGAACAAERSFASAAAVLPVSAATGEGIPRLLAGIDELLPDDRIVRSRFRFPFEDGGKLAFLYEHAQVLERCDDEAGVEVLADVSESVERMLSAHRRNRGL